MKSNVLEKYEEYLEDGNEIVNIVSITKIIDEVIDEVIDNHTHVIADTTNLQAALDDGKGYTEYTFIINSDEKLSNWANNASGNDYSRILIKENKNNKSRGWVLNSTLTGGTSSNPKIVIDISNGRTKSVVGESGSKIVIINNSQSSTYLIGIKGNVTGTYPNFTKPDKEYFFRNVKIEVNCTGGRQRLRLWRLYQSVKLQRHRQQQHQRLQPRL